MEGGAVQVKRYKVSVIQDEQVLENCFRVM